MRGEDVAHVTQSSAKFAVAKALVRDRSMSWTDRRMGGTLRSKFVIADSLDDCTAKALDRESHIHVLSNGGLAFQICLIAQR